MTHPERHEPMTRIATPEEVAAYYNSPEFDPDNDSYPEGPLPVLSDADKARFAAGRWEQGPVQINSGPTIDEVLPPEVWPVPPKEITP